MRIAARALVLLSFVSCAPQRGVAPVRRGQPGLALATFEVAERLGRAARDELVHFDFDVATRASQLVLRDVQGSLLPSQTSDLVREGERVRGRIWTVISLAPKSSLRLELRAASEAQRGALDAAALSVREESGRVVMANDRVAISLPSWPGVLPDARGLSQLPPPLASLRRGDGPWLAGARWVDGGHALPVRAAHTRVLERGPVRAVVEQTLSFADGRSYRAQLTLGARQEAVLIAEHSDVEAPGAALVLSMQSGLGANRVYWQSQWNSRERHGTWALLDTAVGGDREQLVCTLRPWSFWWLENLAEWAGFYRAGQEPLVGVIMLRPSRWSPEGYQGFERTQVPVTARAGGAIELSLPFAAGEIALRDGRRARRSLHREWALTAGTVSEHVVDDPARAKLRQQLVKYGEFPLDELKYYGFDAVPARKPRRVASVLFGPEVLARSRRLAQEDAGAAAQVRRAIQYIEGCGGLAETLDKEGPGAFYERYVTHQLQQALPEAYLGSSDPIYGRFLAAAVKGLAGTVIETFLEAPRRPALGAFGPWFTETITRLVLHYDLIAGAGFLSAEEEAALRSVLVFAGHVLAHPDYWNTARGMSSGNPNMTSSILLARGILGLWLSGHPRSERWVASAEAELERELDEWISPGGAWVESPFYQLASLDSMFLFAQALRNVTGRDAFARQRFKETMDYAGFLLTPPDPRFAGRGQAAPSAAPMVLPSLGHSFAGTVSPFSGWMAAATAAADPEYSARQQFFWERQSSPYQIAHRASGVVLALTDPTLPATPPRELSRAFPDFGTLSRTSWTDSRASYLLHRAGSPGHHFDDDQGSFVYHAKGAPLCLDWGNLYEPLARGESFYHNRVSFDKADSPQHFGSQGKLVTFQTLPDTLDYSHGETQASGGQRTARHLLLIKSRDPLGANYLVVRDRTHASPAGQRFYWNLWCLSRGIEIGNHVVHFPGQLGVDLDVHVLAPTEPQVERDHWSWKQTIYVWREFAEEQYAMRVAKTGGAEDFFMLLDPRVRGQARARVEPLAGALGARVQHVEGTDYLLLSPGAEARVARDRAELRGEIAFVRRHRSGATLLAVVAGARAYARLGDHALASDGPVAIECTARAITGESNGAMHRATIELPRGRRVARATLDGKPLLVTQAGRSLTLELPAGLHRFELGLE